MICYSMFYSFVFYNSHHHDAHNKLRKSIFFTRPTPHSSTVFWQTQANIQPSDLESINSGVRLFLLHPAGYDRQFYAGGYGASVIHLRTKKTILVMPRSRLLPVPTKTKLRGQEVGIRAWPVIMEGLKAWSTHLNNHPQLVQGLLPTDMVFPTILIMEVSQQRQQRGCPRAMNPSRRTTTTTTTILQHHPPRRAIDLYLHGGR